LRIPKHTSLQETFPTSQLIDVLNIAKATGKIPAPETLAAVEISNVSRISASGGIPAGVESDEEYVPQGTSAMDVDYMPLRTDQQHAEYSESESDSDYERSPLLPKKPIKG